MTTDALMMRKGRPFVLANMKIGEGIEAIMAFLSLKGGLKIAEPWARPAPKRPGP